MDFNVKPVSISTDALHMEYFLVPWDSEILGFNVGQISKIKILNRKLALPVYKKFQEWSEQRNIEMCSCRLQHDQLNEVDFLQENNFRFIELNYQPVYCNLSISTKTIDAIEGSSLVISKAKNENRTKLVSIAGKIFSHGRFHQDIYVDSSAADKRYAKWMENSFSHPDQVVYQCTLKDKIVAFFVVEYQPRDLCHWCLVGLAPNLGGRGLGTEVWRSMIRFHLNEGVKTITTSISSHNLAIFNLYVKLGFKFPMPATTLHWHPC